MTLSRRAFAVSAAGFLIGGGNAQKSKSPMTKRRIDLIGAPSNLGLRPNEDGSEPGTWRAPAVLFSAGLARALSAEQTRTLARPCYKFDAQPGTRIRNGQALRDYSQLLAATVEKSLGDGLFPIAIGGDCSILIGSLLGARRSGCRGLIHIDGHSDFFHPGNYDSGSRLGTAAGMDLALVTGRGEPLLTAWPEIEGPLVVDEDAIQVGERDAFEPEYAAFYEDLARTSLTRFLIQDMLRIGVPAVASAITRRLEERSLDRAWLHIDLDVLDETVMPAVDSPGRPGLIFEQLSTLVAALLATGRIAGANVTIYDPDRDPNLQFSKPIVKALADAFVSTNVGTRY